MSARSSGTTSIATISAPASSARWASSGPDSSSLSRRETVVEMVRMAARTAAQPIRPRRSPAAIRRLAPGLLHEDDTLDLEVALQSLDHVVDGQGRHAGGGEG